MPRSTALTVDVADTCHCGDPTCTFDGRMTPAEIEERIEADRRLSGFTGEEVIAMAERGESLNADRCERLVLLGHGHLLGQGVE